MMFAGCGEAAAQPAPSRQAELALGVADRGIFGDLDGRLQLPAPAAVHSAARPSPQAVAAVLDRDKGTLVVEVGGWPVKVYPVGPASGRVAWRLGEHVLELRAGDRAELEGLLRAEAVRVVGAPSQAGAAPLALADRDGDGIPDPLDVLLGAKKTVLNADAYTGGYVRISYPMGDVPRTLGVCTDVIVRAVRNAGLDLQRELHEDIRRAPRAYPMVKGRGDPNIDHRRVKTLLPYFVRHWQRRSVALDDAEDPLRPGDVVLMDTFPSRTGPDHIGIVSDLLGPSGKPLIINNWTDGTVTAEMDLLPFVPITHRFRIPPEPRAPSARRRR